MALLSVLLASALYVSAGLAHAVYPKDVTTRQSATGVDACPGYVASNVKQTANSLTADLTLAGEACNVYGVDLKDLTLLVEYQTDSRLHVLIQDADSQVYQVPETVFTRPTSGNGTQAQSKLVFDYVESPFSFTVKRNGTGEVLFDTSAASFVFETQYIRLRTKLPANPSLYGTGEHTDPFMLNTSDYTRIIWNRDAYTTPAGTNLYGDHPVHFDHRGANGTHGVFLLNSNGKNIKINDTDGQYLEYDLLGGVLDFYFLAGPTPVDVAMQYADVVGKSAMMPYWGLGFHQCRYGMRDVYEVAEVVANYSAANIPLETMWTDIDYMNLRQVFSVDPARFPLDLMQELVSTLHARQQHYVLMVDPAVAYQNYAPFNDGRDKDVFLKTADNEIYQGVVWPGVTAFPDWFAPNTQEYWTGQFASFFNKDTGVDIDALWIDMNEASNFCVYPCTNATLEAQLMGDPPRPPPIRLGPDQAIDGFPASFQPRCHAQISFSVNASTRYGENIYVMGNTLTLGNDNVVDAVPLNANNYPIWQVTVDVPANSTISYQYLRLETDGSYVYEDVKNRTFTSGGCDSQLQLPVDSIGSVTPSNANMKRSPSLEVDAVTHSISKRQSNGTKLGLPNRNLINPAYDIGNVAGSLSNKTLDTDLVNANGMVVYDTHNLYGAQMSEASRLAMLSRRPGLRPLIITRSTFAGSGRQVGHWLGDNYADWEHYLYSIKEMLEFGALYQVPMVGSDVCGFAGNTNERLCARWASLGAFAPFYRNHGSNDAIPHEFYRWPLVAKAAQNAIEIRYKMLDYIYTAMYVQSETGKPLVQPMFFKYPEDPKVNALGYQYFWGDGVMIAPVTEDNSTTATFYMPKDTFYDYYTHEKIEGQGAMMTMENVDFTTIPIYYRAGYIIAQRANSANTTAELRKQSFTLVIVPDADGKAEGELYLDDGVSVEQPNYSFIHFSYHKRALRTSGRFSFATDVAITKVVVLGVHGHSNVTARSEATVAETDGATTTTIPLTEAWSGNV